MIMGNTKYTYVIINRNSGDTYNSWILWWINKEYPYKVLLRKEFVHIWCIVV